MVAALSSPLPAPYGAVSGAARTLFGLALVGVVTVITAVVALPLLPWRVARIKLHNLYGKIVGRLVVFLVGVRPEVRGGERLDGSMPAIYVANHASNLDFFLCVWMCPYGGCGVVKKEFVYLPFCGWLYLLSGHLRISRGDRARAIVALQDTGRLVKRHRLGVWIMPEGSRSRDGRLQPFKKGFVHMAIATGLPVVPVVLHDAHLHWPRHSVVPIRSGTVTIDVLPAIDTSGWREETADDHARLVHDQMVAVLAPAQRPAA